MSNIIGVTGNIGSGKSSVCTILRKHGAAVADADEIAHSIILRGQPAYGEIIHCFGKSILDENMEISRQKLGDIVFYNSAKLDQLSEITHKYVVSKMLDFAELERKKNTSLIVLDTPLLHLAKLDKHCDDVLVVCANESLRVERIIRRSNISHESALARARAQKNILELLTGREFIIYNEGTRLELENIVITWLKNRG